MVRCMQSARSTQPQASWIAEVLKELSDPSSRPPVAGIRDPITMPVYSKFQSGILVAIAVGQFTYDEFVEAVVHGYTDPSFTEKTPVLIDARESKADLTSADVHNISSRILGRRPAGHIGRWALVTSTEPLRFGIARMGALTMQSLGVPMEVFTDLRAALDYLNG